MTEEAVHGRPPLARAPCKGWFSRFIHSPSLHICGSCLSNAPSQLVCQGMLSLNCCIRWRSLNMFHYHQSSTNDLDLPSWRSPQCEVLHCMCDVKYFHLYFQILTYTSKYSFAREMIDLSSQNSILHLRKYENATFAIFCYEISQGRAHSYERWSE